MVKKTNRQLWVGVIIGAAYGLLYPFITDIVGLKDTEHLTTVMPISIAVGGLCGLVIGYLWKYFARRKTTHGW